MVFYGYHKSVKSVVMVLGKVLKEHYKNILRIS